MSYLIVLSGGIDSVTALYKILNEHPSALIETVSFDYGSKHNAQEYRAVEVISARLQITNTRIDIGFINDLFKSDLLSSGGEIPEGHYAASNMERTIVPFRNGIMLSIAAGFAESIGCRTLVIGNHRGDSYVYPDCRHEFIHPMGEAIRYGTQKQIRLLSPFCYLTKTDIVRIGGDLGIPYELTYSCYKGGDIHCGKCGTCYERREAFRDSGVEDKTVYKEVQCIT